MLNNTNRYKFNIYDIHQNILDKKNRKIKIYEVLLAKIYNKIYIGSNNNILDCYYEVPYFVVGHPLYDIKLCIAYIIANLRKSGFLVKYSQPNYLYINWDFTFIIEEKKNKALIESSKTITNTTINRGLFSDSTNQNNLPISIPPPP